MPSRLISFVLAILHISCAQLPEQREMEPYPRPLLPEVVAEPHQPATIIEDARQLETAGGCWVKLFEQQGQSGESIIIHFSAEMPTSIMEIPTLELGPGADWTNRVESIRTGPLARAELFWGTYFTDDSYLVMPNMEIDGIDALGWTNLGSLRIRCE
jgi:hypothetical protein